MNQNKLSTKLKETSTNSLIPIIGVSTIIIYKVWKIFVRHYSANHEAPNLSELLFTCFRILATILGLILIKKYYKNIRSELSIGNKKIFITNLFVGIPLYFLSRYALFQLTFDSHTFITELYTNFFVGSFEELFFRGLILVGLCQYMNSGMSILLSSLLFTFWHYDVVPNPYEYIIIFSWGIYAGYCFLNGASLLSLILFHYLWDLVFFGFWWDGARSVAAIVGSQVGLILILAGILTRGSIKGSRVVPKF